MACWFDSLDAPLARAASRGLAVAESGTIGERGRFAYLDTEAHGADHTGTVVEISEISGAKGRFFDHVRTTARDWDGRDPIRPIPSTR